jgi:hypothetical protein
VVELFVPNGAPLPSASVTSVLHFDQSPLEKATASSCTVPAGCTTNNSTLDAAIAERMTSSVRITFIDNGSGFLCSATLLNTPRYPIGFLLTANHCISTAGSASSMTSFWFYEPNSCSDPSLKPGSVQLANGAQLTFTNYNADSTLLQMVDSPPGGASYSGWSAALLNTGDAVVSLSHPHGDTTRQAIGSVTQEYRITNRAQDEYGISFSSGIIEGGSSGSGLYTLSGSSLQLRGVLTGTTLFNSSTGMSCTDLNEDALYGRFEIFSPEIAAYISGSGTPTPDDEPNRVIDYTGLPLDAPLNGRTVGFDRNIDYVGDVDVFQFNLNAQATVTLGTQGSMDTVGTLMDSSGHGMTANDDVGPNDTNFGITQTLDPGTYYVMVAPWDPQVTGPYHFTMSASSATTNSATNYSDLWWSAESGWGINLNHQGTVIFATLYTYDTNGQPMWL